jgi:protein-tyrosine phosphatase
LDLLGPMSPNSIVFGAEHAEAIVRFIEEWRHADRIVVHCGAGLSRSPGVALGLCDRAGWPTAAIERNYPLWNTLVRKVLAAHRHLDEDVPESRTS